ncbi:MAG: hypothetical protein NTZ42_02910 [Candidatus Gribaldobacteria bacterium]|nr:hypothetical protein [Candidatus Gribaldobacteria bacterium]
MIINTKNILIASGVVVVGVVVVLASGLWRPSWNPFGSSGGGDIVIESLTKSMAAKSFELDSQLAIDMETTSAILGDDGAAKQVKLNLTVQDQINKANPKEMKAKALINLALQTEGATVSADLEGIGVGDNVYLKLTSFPSFLPLPIDLTKIKDQWVKLSIKDLQNKLAASGLQMPANGEDDFKTTLKNLQDIAHGKKFFDIQRRLGQEDVAGAMADHYAVGLNKRTVRDFIPAYLDLAKKYAPQDQQAQTEQQISEIKADLNTNFEKYWESLGGLSFEVWIDKASGRLVKVSWQKEIDPSKFSQTQQDIKKMNLRVELTLSKFNESFEVAEPSDFKTAEELLGALIPTNGATSTKP